jgi:short-subunit dehydrogenase
MRQVPAGTVVVTGASSGIGAASAARLAALGFPVIGVARRPGPEGPGLRRVAADVTDRERLGAVVDEAASGPGGLYALVCAAGYGVFGSVEEVSVARARAQFETNLFGVLHGLQAALPHLRRQGRGRLVVVGSLAGRAPIPFQAHYSASKAALDAFVLALRGELHGSGVWASLVEPGDVRTAFNDRTDWGPGSSAYGERARAAETVIRRAVERAPGPELVARAVERAVLARRPRVRYAVGPDALAVGLGRRLLPDAAALALIRRHFGI